jgi:hypothetical protein
VNYWQFGRGQFLQTMKILLGFIQIQSHVQNARQVIFYIATQIIEFILNRFPLRRTKAAIIYHVKHLRADTNFVGFGKFRD